MAGKWRKKQTVSHEAHSEEVGRTLSRLDHKVVSEGSSGPGWRQRMPGFRSVSPRALRLGFAGLVLLALVVGGYMYVNRQKETPIAPGPKCSANQLGRAAASFDASRLTYLEPIVTDIKKTPGYEQDVNCLYVVMTYHLNISDAKTSRELLNKLKTLYEPKTGYHRAMADKARTPEQLESSVQFLEARAKESYGSFSGGEGSD